jgi:hypothetical protein
MGGPDVLDSPSGAGAVVATAVVREWFAGVPIGTAGTWDRGQFFPAVPLLSAFAAVLPLSVVGATRAVVAFALWTCGFAGWRAARTWAPGSGLVGGYAVALAAQVAAGRATIEADLPAFTAGFVLLALAHPRAGVLAAAMGLPASSAIATIAIVRRQPWLAAGFLGFVALFWGSSRLPGAALRQEPPVPTVPAYGTTSGAWFPMPPLEAATWTAVENRGELWLSPRSALLVGEQPPAPFVDDASRTPPARPAATDESAPISWKSRWLARRAAIEARIDSVLPVVGAERRAIGRGTMFSPLGAILLFLALRACERRQWGRFVPVIAGVLATAGAGLLWLREVRHDEGVTGRDMIALVDAMPERPLAQVILVPPPSFPYFAGRIHPDRWLGFRAAMGKADALDETSTPVVNLLAELARKAEYGLDAQAAEGIWLSPRAESPVQAVASSGPLWVIIDRMALPAPAFRLVEGWMIREAGQPVARSGDLVAFEIRNPGSDP